MKVAAICVVVLLGLLVVARYFLLRFDRMMRARKEAVRASDVARLTAWIHAWRESSRPRASLSVAVAGREAIRVRLVHRHGRRWVTFKDGSPIDWHAEGKLHLEETAKRLDLPLEDVHVTFEGDAEASPVGDGDLAPLILALLDVEPSLSTETLHISPSLDLPAPPAAVPS